MPTSEHPSYTERSKIFGTKIYLPAHSWRMHLGSITAIAALVVSAMATPLLIDSSRDRVLDKRATPDVKQGDYSDQQVNQIKKAHSDAIKMASTVVSWSKHPDTFDPIFKKYFDIADRDPVVGVFRQIIGKDDGNGHDLLGQITAVKDWKDDDGDDDEFSCTPGTDAELRDYESEHPKLVVCPQGLALGAIGTDFPGVPGVKCETFYPRISKNMNTLGFVLLHEYTHWDTLMTPVMLGPFGEKAALDEAVGCYKVRRLSRHAATWNADSYAWLAQEIWWTQTCYGLHGPLEEPEEGDN